MEDGASGGSGFGSLILFTMDIRHGIAGGMAGVAVDVVFYPLDTIKTRIMGSSPGENLTALAKSKFKGFTCQMIVSFPYSFTFFYVYESVRANIDHPLKNVIASVAAEIVANIVRNPFEVVKQQLMAGRSDRVTHSLIDIFKNKGIMGLYTGYKSTIARDMLFSACQLPLFETLRELNYLALSPILNASLSGSIAAIIAGFISCPLDVLKTRLMTQDMNRQSINSIFAQLYGERGLGAFFVGVKIRCISLCIGGIVYFGALQQARSSLGL